MKKELTQAERELLARIASAGKWDHLLYDLSLLTPCFIIMGLGIHFDSPATILTGMLVYAGFALRTPLHQAKTIPVLKSLLLKLTENGESPTQDCSLSSESASSDGQRIQSSGEDRN